MRKISIIFILVLSGFFSTKAQDSLFYYAYTDSIPLSKSNNKAVIRFIENKSGDMLTHLITSLGFNSNKLSVQTIDSSTFIITYPPINDLIASLKLQSDVFAINPAYLLDNMELGVTDEILLRFNSEIPSEEIEEMYYSYDLSVKREGTNYFLLSVAAGEDALQIANVLAKNELVMYAFPNFLFKPLMGYMPNDPYFSYQFGFHNTGQTINDGHVGTVDADIDAPEAWDITKGNSDISIAIIDGGVTDNHPDLPTSRQERLPGSNFAAAYDASNPDPDDPSPVMNSYHGNACAGIAGATMDNNEGITGIAPLCHIMPVRIAIDFVAPVADYADAITFAWQNNADVISISWYSPNHFTNLFPTIRDAIEDATILGRNGLGCVVAACVGNQSDQLAGDNGVVGFPANVEIPGVLSVGASDRNDLQSNYSPDSDPQSIYNQIVDLTAPSHSAYACQGNNTETYEVWTIDNIGGEGINPWPYNQGGGSCTNPPAYNEQLPSSGTNYEDYTGRFGGTSASTPLVAGVAGLMLSVNPCLTQLQVFDILTNTTDKVGGYIYPNGFSNELGNGRVNAYSAVAASSAMYLSGASDLYMKDTRDDWSTEPNPTTDPLYLSEDIWVRHTNDGIQNQTTENPEYDAINPNFVYVKIRNHGCIDFTSSGELVHVYWSKASTGLSWPTTWDNFYDNCPGLTLFGDEIESGKVIPNIPAGQETIVWFEWYPPNPANYTWCGDQNHFCLLARIPDGMTNPETSVLWQNVRDNNNIVWKNVTVVDDITFIHAGLGQTIIRNVYEDTIETKLSFILPENEPNFLDYGSIKINLGAELFNRWQDSGSVGNGFEICDDTLIKLTGNASIESLFMDTSEMFVIESYFDLYVQDSNFCNFNFDIMQYDSLIGDTGLQTGGVRFQLNTCNPEISERRGHNRPDKQTLSYPYKIFPNPNSGSMFFEYVMNKSDIGYLSIYDIAGKNICSYDLKEGKNTLEIKEGTLPPGIYFYSMYINQQRVLSNKLIIVK